MLAPTSTSLSSFASMASILARARRASSRRRTVMLADRMPDMLPHACLLGRSQHRPIVLQVGVPGVTMLTVVADENKRREYLNRAKVMLKRNSR
jgi:hypothetical protein